MSKEGKLFLDLDHAIEDIIFRFRLETTAELARQASAISDKYTKKLSEDAKQAVRAALPPQKRPRPKSAPDAQSSTSANSGGGSTQ